MKRLAIKYLYPLARLYWFLFRPKTFGAKLVIQNGNDILMVRHTYGSGGWTFPGGGIKYGETPEDAAKREAREELGIEVKNLKSIGVLLTTDEYKRDTIHCFSASVENRDLKIQKEEILEAKWFSRDNILDNIRPQSNARKIIELWQNNIYIHP